MREIFPSQETDGFDVKRVFFGAAIWGILTIVLLGAQYGFGDTSNLVFQFQPFNFIMMCIVILIFIPFQVAFEEFIFRGYLMQGSILLCLRVTSRVQPGSGSFRFLGSYAAIYSDGITPWTGSHLG